MTARMANRSEAGADRVRRIVNQERGGDGCWLWREAKPGNYGRVSADGQKQAAHRVAYILAYGNVPEGKVVHHICAVKACVRPDHLQAVTQSEHKRLHAHPRRYRLMFHFDTAPGKSWGVEGYTTRRRAVEDAWRWKKVKHWTSFEVIAYRLPAPMRLEKLEQSA